MDHRNDSGAPVAEPHWLVAKAKALFGSKAGSHARIMQDKQRQEPASSDAPPTVPEHDAVLRELTSNQYAFIDLGCGTGSSIDHCQRRFNATPGLGIDYTKTEVLSARAQGYAVYWCNFLDQSLPSRCVGFVSMLDTLEHLPADISINEVLAHVAKAARDFLFIRHPSFEPDDIAQLEALGLKIGWTDWTGHSNPMSVADFRHAFETLGWRDYVIIPHMFLDDTSSEHIVPIECPTDTTRYDVAIHRSKPFSRFERPIAGKFDIFVRLDPQMPDHLWNRISNIEGWEAQ
jgi:SAM-dependent methyltransferase